MSKKALTFLIIGFIFFLVVILAIAGVVAALLSKDNKKNDDKGGKAQTESNNGTKGNNGVVVANPNVTSKDIYAMVNCKLYKLSATKATPVSFTNKTKVTCFFNQIIPDAYTTIRPTYENVIKSGVGDKAIFLLDLTTKKVTQLNYNVDSSTSGAYDPVNKKFYTYVFGRGLYSGTLAKPLTTKIYDPQAVLLGRGGMFGDEMAIRISPNGEKILIVDTYSSENKDGSDYKQIKVLDKNGTLVFSDNGTAAKWVDNDKIVYVNRDFKTGNVNQLAVRDLSTNSTQEINGFENAYHLDVLGNYLLIDYFTDTLNYKSGDLRTAVMKLSDNTLVDNTITKKSDNYLLDINTIISHTTFDCSGEWDSGAQYPCPLEGVYNFYQKSIISHSLVTSKDQSLIVYKAPELF